MKTLSMLSFLATALFIFTACSDRNGEDNYSQTESTSEYSEYNIGTGINTRSSGGFVNLRTGSAVRWDEVTGRFVDDFGSPVDFYINMNTQDTFFGETDQRVNNALIHENGDWRLDESKVEIEEDSKLKIEEDEIKIKDADSKIKLDDDEYKAK